MDSWLLVLTAGLLAGATTCAVTQGGLLVGLLTRQRKAAGVTRQSLADDVVPTLGFLAGKLVSHTLLGAVLGAIGGTFALNAKFGGMAQWFAGLLMIVLGLGTLGVPGFRDIKFAPPESWTGMVRNSTRSKSAQAPAMLGLGTVAIPCGVTISMELLAATSGSALLGAATMALFILGTAPMFLVFGVLAQRLASRFSALNFAMGGVVVLMGLYTINAGMVALGSPYSVQALLAGDRPTPTASATQNGEEQVIEVTALNTGFSPTSISAKAGEPTKIVFKTDGVWSCIRSIVVPDLSLSTNLPETGNTELDLGVLQPGVLDISCSMGMYNLQVVVS